jgi:tungstate transport system ATP-binding protein
VILYRLSQIQKTYLRRTVLDISFLDIEVGKIYALLGPNGAGKTTLLNILAFLDVPSSGDVSFRSQPVRYTQAALQELRKKVVMVDQHPIMFTTSVYKNVEFGLKIRGVPKNERERIVEESLDLVGMRPFASAPAHRLSGGETQRVALARALALSPEVFLCDEPTSGIDAENREVVIDILRQINREKQISLIITTHDRSQASTLTRRILVLEGGRLTATAYENVFTGVIETRGESTVRFRIRNGLSVELAKGEVDPHRNQSKIYIDPAELKLIPPTGKRHLANTISGRVVSAALENDHVRVVVDAGVSMTAFLPAAEYRNKRVMVGDAVQLLAPPESIRLL